MNGQTETAPIGAMEDILCALTDDARLGILVQLTKGPMNVSELTNSLEIDISNTSRKLKKLFKVGLLRSNRQPEGHFFSLGSCVTIIVTDPEVLRISIEGVGQERVQFSRRWSRFSFAIPR